MKNCIICKKKTENHLFCKKCLKTTFQKRIVALQKHYFSRKRSPYKKSIDSSEDEEWKTKKNYGWGWEF